MYFESEDRTKQIIILRTSIIGGISLLLMLFLSFKSVIPSIEKDLLNKVSIQLMENKLDNILVTAKGQDIYLEGIVDENSRAKALQVAGDIYGVSKVHDQFIITKN